jgi:VanZ family protein
MGSIESYATSWRKNGKQLINSKLARNSCAGAAFLMAITLFLGAEKVADVPLFPPPFDKVMHFTYYGVMAAFLAHAVGARWLWVPLILVPLVGVADEWNQLMIAGRDASIWDWIADGMGATVFVYGYRKWAVRTRSSR